MRHLRMAGGLYVLQAAAVLVRSAIVTSSARVSATTEANSVLGAGTTTLDTKRANLIVDFVIDAEHDVAAKP